jgi:uncharacterized protein YbcI
MTIKELMEVVGETRFNYIKILMRDALIEMEQLTNENVVQYTSDIIENQSSYDLPSNMVKLDSVKVKNTKTGKYEPIKRIIPIDGIKEE